MTATASSVTIRELPIQERPRERLRRYGADPLSNAELISLLLGSGLPGENALALANRLLARFGGLNGINKAAFSELCAERGLSAAKAGQLLAALELGRRSHAYASQDRPVIHSPEDAANLLQAEMSLLEQEHLKVMLLNAKNQVIRIITLYIGNVSSSHVRPAEVFKAAIRENACQVIALHNHPSGDPTPSGEDAHITRKMAAAGKMLDIELLDHIVIGAGNRFVSMKKQKLGFD